MKRDIYLNVKKIKGLQQPFCRYADQVSVGDEVLVQGNDKLMTTEVIEIS